MRGMKGGTDGTDKEYHDAGRSADSGAPTHFRQAVWRRILWGYLICCVAVFCAASGVVPPSMVEGPYSQDAGGLSQGDGADPDPALTDEEQDLLQTLPAEGPASNEYLNQLIREVVEEIYTPGMTEYERAKAAYDWILDTVAEGEPIGFEIWRVHSEDPDTPIPFVENRALSALQYRVGKCEEMSGALILLLQGMGMEAEYMPGLIFSIQGDPLDHAWIMAKVDGVWYHMDPNLECYRARRKTVRYLHFLKGDETMLDTHRWGEYIFPTPWLSTEQREEISEYYMGHPCPEDYDTPEARDRDPAVAPDEALVQQEIDEEIAAYEEIHGVLEPIELDIVPPVFGFEGYGPDIY